MARHLYYDQLVTLAGEGGYTSTVRLSQLTSVFLLSACLVLMEKWLWQTPLEKISDTEYENILQMIETAEYELMDNMAVGTIFSTVADLSAYDNVLAMLGQTVAQSDYPELTAVAPSDWLVSTDIEIPSMNDRGVFGKNSTSSNLGRFRGENKVTLTVDEIPSHNHTQNPHSHSEVIPVVTPSLGGEIPALADLTVPTPSVTGLTTATNNATGGGMEHENVPRVLLIRWYLIVR